MSTGKYCAGMLPQGVHSRIVHEVNGPDVHILEAGYERTGRPLVRFSRIVGVAPMQYLVAWRMSLARKLLQNGDLGVAQLADRVGYSPGSTFSVAFTRHVGLPPSRYARQPPPAGGA